MALADYRQCDVCGGKTYYDSYLNYPDEQDIRERGWTAGLPVGAGAMKVICRECAKTHTVVVIKKVD